MNKNDKVKYLYRFFMKKTVLQISSVPLGRGPARTVGWNFGTTWRLAWLWQCLWHDVGFKFPAGYAKKVDNDFFALMKPPIWTTSSLLIFVADI